jgi:dipeptidyl aminopeptidase/acylaminoacyl peptidase
VTKIRFTVYSQFPNSEPPEGGYRAIVFNHGYIPPSQYKTTERYLAYVDYLAKNNFVVFKIDFRGHGNSEGNATGSYFSNGYTVDAINAVKSLQKLNYVNKNRIGMWGHSMSGNVTLRSMLVSPDIQAGVIWGGAVYSYEDLAKYGLVDSSYIRSQTPTLPDAVNDPNSGEIQKLRSREKNIDFSSSFWKSVSLTQNIS